MKFKIITCLTFIAAVMSSCSDDLENVENRIFDFNSNDPEKVLIDGQKESQTVSFTVNLSSPLTFETDVEYAADLSLIEAYNTLYSESAIALPPDNYNLIQPQARFIPGAVVSSPVEIEIVNLMDLDRNTVYVLPLHVSESTVPVLESQKTRYIVVRGAALVNIAADIANNYMAFRNIPSEIKINGLAQMTVQCLVNIDKFGGNDANIQTLLGVEGRFLLRISDAGLPINQLQFVTPDGNLTDESWQLEANKWLALSLTYDNSVGEATLFVNGVRKATCANGCGSKVNWGSYDFHIGYSWNENRWLNGSIAEVRVWNKVLSDATIAEPDQPYFISPLSEGLVAYWKINEGSGLLIHDYAFGQDLVCEKEPKWVAVALPEQK